MKAKKIVKMTEEGWNSVLIADTYKVQKILFKGNLKNEDEIEDEIEEEEIWQAIVSTKILGYTREKLWSRL